MIMKGIQAAVLRKAGGPFEIESVEIDDPREDEILVENVATGICHTDIMVCDGHANDKPVILGHEGAGIVVETGKNVRNIRAGDHVLLSFQYCGECEQCRNGQPWKCQYMGDLNFGYMRRDGSNAYLNSGVYGHFFGQSSFATHSLVTENNCIKVSHELSLETLCPLGCGIQTGAGTVMNLMKVPKGSSIAVFGTGAVGIAAIMAARIVGAAVIIGIDIHQSRLELARELGATHIINSSQDDAASMISSITGSGVDFSLDLTSNPAVSQLAVDVLNPGGSFANIARPWDVPELSEGKKSVGVTMGSAIPQEFIPELIRYYQSGDFPFDRLEKFYDFSEINQAIADSRSGVTIKPVLRFKQE
jgi:aryl-alcohol dehydrogenase